jgi:hypothetical protein
MGLAVIDVSWTGVVLVLGIVGMSLLTVCFTIWTMRKRENVRVDLTPPPPLPPPPPVDRWPGEEETKEVPPR